MAKQRERVEFRYYEIPETESVLALLGEDWIREYGKEIKYLHFHNLMEIGYCHWGNYGILMLAVQVCTILLVEGRIPEEVEVTSREPEVRTGFWGLWHIY